MRPADLRAAGPRLALARALLLLAFLGLRIHALASRPAGLSGGGLLAALALFAHEFAAGALLAAFLVDALLRAEEGGLGARLRRRLPFYLVSLAGLALFLVLRQRFVGGQGPAASHAMGLLKPVLIPGSSLSDQISLGLAGFGRLWHFLLFPHPLTLDYASFVIQPGWDSAALLGIAGLILPVLAGLLLRKRTPLILFGALLADAFFLLPSNLVVLNETPFSDRFLVLPLAGGVLAVVGLLQLLAPARKLVPLAIAVVLAFPGLGLAWNRAGIWSDSESFLDAMREETTAAGNLQSAQSAFLQAARISSRFSDVEGARDFLDKSLEIYPDNFQCHEFLASLLIDQGKKGQDTDQIRLGALHHVEAASIALDDFGGESRQFAQVVFEIRRSFGQVLGDLPTALQKLSELVPLAEERGGSSWLDLYRGEIHLALGDVDRAEGLLKKAERAAARNTKVLIWSKFLRSVDRKEEAYQEVDKIPAARKEDFERAQLGAAEWAVTDGLVDQAVQRYQRVINLPGVSDAAKLEAMLMLPEAILGQYDQALKTGDKEKARLLKQDARAKAENALRFGTGHPRRIVSLAVLAQIALADQEFPRAISICQEILKEDPDNLEALKWLGSAHKGNKDKDKALEAFAHAAEIRSESLPLARTALTAALEVPDIQAGLHWLEESKRRIKIHGGAPSTSLITDQARLYRLEARALEAGELDAQLDPSSRTPEGRQAASHAKYQEGLDLLNKAMADHPESPALLRSRGLVEGEMGLADQGFADLKKALELVQASEETRARKQLEKTLRREIRTFRRAGVGVPSKSDGNGAEEEKKD
ncbi:MAG: tetratricopeptide repeat protein [Planctomycetota bacterium]